VRRRCQPTGCAFVDHERHSERRPAVPQPRLHWCAYLWPGLPQVWLRGSWVGLILAVGFTAIANVLLAATLVWEEWLPARGRWIGLAGLAVIWVVAWIEGRAEWRRLIAQWKEGAEESDNLPDPVREQGYREAQTAYLAADWVSAERRLLELLRYDARDAEARLLLATLWRHEDRHEAALRELDVLERLETAAAWAFEIATERERIAAASVKTDQNEGTDLGGPACPGPMDRQLGAAPARETEGSHARSTGAVATDGGMRAADGDRRMAA
jgi:hypothetical protein